MGLSRFELNLQLTLKELFCSSTTCFIVFRLFPTVCVWLGVFGNVRSFFRIMLLTGLGPSTSTESHKNHSLGQVINQAMKYFLIDQVSISGDRLLIDGGVTFGGCAGAACVVCDGCANAACALRA